MRRCDRLSTGNRLAACGLRLALGASFLAAACGSYRPKVDDTSPPNDGGVPPDSAHPCSESATAGSQGGEWLHTSCNRILKADGTQWMGRGANLPDTRGCDACTIAQPNVDEVVRRMDALVDGWGASFLRIDLEAYAQQGPRVQWKTALDD